MAAGPPEGADGLAVYLRRHRDCIYIRGDAFKNTENSILINHVTELPNVSGDDRVSLFLLPDPVRLAIQVGSRGETNRVSQRQCDHR